MASETERKKYQFENPVIEVYRGHAIKKYNMIFIRVNNYEIKKFIDAKLDFGLSTRAAIEKQRLLFPCNQQVIVPTKKMYDQSS